MSLLEVVEAYIAFKRALCGLSVPCRYGTHHDYMEAESLGTA